MTTACRWTFFALFAIPIARAADPDAVLAQVRAKVLAEATRIPRFVCRQNIQRQAFAPVSRNGPSCAEVVEDWSDHPPSAANLVATDRAKLDVMLTAESELFSWPRSPSFDVRDPGELLGGGFSGSGDFASFRLAIFSSDKAAIHFDAPCGASCLRFRYDIAPAVSRYTLRTARKQTIVGYHGAFELDAAKADLLSLTVIPTGVDRAIPGVCSLRTSMTYAQSDQFLLPAVTEKSLITRDGSYLENETRYEGCRQYSSESVLTFEDGAPHELTAEAPPVIPPPAPKSELVLRLVSKIDSDSSSAGDAIVAALTRAVRSSTGATIPAGTLIHGHIALLEQVVRPRPEIVLAVRFDSIGDQTPLQLEPIGRRDPRGRGVYSFPSDRIILTGNFVTRWRVP